MPRTLRVSLNIDELREIVGALRERLDGYDEALQEDLNQEEFSWYAESLAVIRPLERRLTKRGGLC